MRAGVEVTGYENTGEKKLDKIFTLSNGLFEEWSPKVTMNGMPDESLEERTEPQKLFGCR